MYIFIIKFWKNKLYVRHDKFEFHCNPCLGPRKKCSLKININKELDNESKLEYLAMDLYYLKLKFKYLRSVGGRQYAYSVVR